MKKNIILSILTIITLFTLSSFQMRGIVSGCFFLGNNELCASDLAACQFEWLRVGQKAHAGKIIAKIEHINGKIKLTMDHSECLKVLNVKDLSKYKFFKIHSNIPIPDEVCKSLRLNSGSFISKGECKYEVMPKEIIIWAGSCPPCSL